VIAVKVVESGDNLGFAEVYPALLLREVIALGFKT
jgi:hypothetical protein